MPYVEMSIRIVSDEDIDDTKVAAAMNTVAAELDAEVFWEYTE